MSDLKTALYQEHLDLGGKMVSFASYEMPILYKDYGVIQEHQRVRSAAGLFDVSHMGSLVLEGEDSLENLQYLLTNDFSQLTDGQVRYTLMLNEQGGVIDDFIVYRYHKNKYLLVVNAANRQKDFAWLEKHLSGDCKLVDLTEQRVIIALQGPAATNILTKLIPSENLPAKYYHFKDQLKVLDFDVMVSRTGYTGELGYEIYLAKENGPRLWQELLRLGKEDGLIPSGLGARDTLRLEAGMPLYGQEMSEQTLPTSAGLTFAVKLNKADFIGKAAIIAAGETPVTRVGLKVIGKGIVREKSELVFNDEVVGIVTSGTHSPTLGYGIAMGRLPLELSHVGQKLIARVRKREIEVEVVPLPFYQRS